MTPTAMMATAMVATAMVATVDGDDSCDDLHDDDDGISVGDVSINNDDDDDDDDDGSSNGSELCEDSYLYSSDDN